MRTTKLWQRRPFRSAKRRGGLGVRPFELLEDRLALAARPVISEFMADNAGALLDGDGNASDWIEIFNAGDAQANLANWSLSDDAGDPVKWPFPAITLAAGEYLVVFASGQPVSDYVDAGGSYHTNFGLSLNGEYLSLAENGVVQQDFGTQFPAQIEDVSYGLDMATNTLVGPVTPLEYLVPTDNTLEPAWRSAGFTNPSLVTGGVSTSSSSLVLTEIGTDAVDFVEVQNVSGTPLNTAGWRVVVNNAEAAPAGTNYAQLVSTDPGLVGYWRLGENVVPQGGSVTHGQAVVDRTSPDSFHGVAVFDTPLPNGGQGSQGRVATWQFFNNTPGTNGQSITPLLLEDIGVDQYMVRGIGTTRTVTEAGLQSWDFAVAQGTDTFDWTLGRFHIGIRYGSPTVSNPGVVEFSAGGNGWDFFGSATGAPNVVLNTQITGASTFNNLGRDYSVQYTVVATTGGGGGMTAVDLTGNHNGSYTTAGVTGNKPGAIVGDANTAVDLAGGTISVPHHAALNSAGGALTVEAWVQPDAAGAFQWIVAKDSNNNATTPGLDYLLGINPTGQFRFITQGLSNDAVAASPSTFNGSTWYHVVGVQDPASSTVRLYVNGQLAASAPLAATGVTSPSDLKIGDRSASGGGQRLDGRVDDVALYSRALSAGDVQNHYLSGIAALGGGIAQVNPTIWQLPSTMSAGASAYRTDDAADNYWGSDIRWNTTGPGWAMIVDAAGAIVDFAAWGYTSAQLAGLTVRVGTQDIAVGSEWTGNGVAALGTAANTLQRQGDLDHDNATDFTWRAASKGVTNAGLSVPFQTTLTPLFGGIGYSDDSGPGGAGETIGPNVVARATVDGASGSIFLLDNHPFTEAGQVTEWSFYSTNTLMLTPLIFRLEEGSFELVGVGQTRTSTGTGVQTYPFALQSGSDLVEGGNYYFGFKDGSNATGNTGVIGWDDNTGDRIRWFGGGHAGDLIAGNSFDGGQTFPRSYSLQAKTTVSLSNEINTDVAAAMSGRTSLYVRYPFLAAGPQSAATLALRIKYDDGFIAYLNGTEIARRNVSPTTAFDSVASSNRPLDAVRQFEEINVSQFANLLVVGPNVLAIHGLNDSAASSEFLIDAQLVAGGLSEPLVHGFFTTPTPGGPNTESFAGFVADTSFSVDRGFYTTPQSVQITSATPGATIVYTTDGSTPTLTHGTVVSAPDANSPPVATVNVNKTTTLRAAAFKAGMQATNADTQTYIFVADVVNQSVISPSIRNHPVWGPQLAGSLTAVPTISIVTQNSVSQTEQATSVEMIFPDGTPGFQVDAGVETFGGTSLGFAKQSLRISFKDQYGPTKLNFPVFEGTPGGETATEEFDQILLRSGSHDTRFYTHGNGTQGIYFRNRWAFDRQLEMGQPAPHGRFVQVYLNGVYWGQYDLMERPNAGFMESYFGGEKEDYDAINAGNAVDGDLTAWNAMTAAAGNFEQLSQYLDIDNYVDYTLLNFYAGNDWDWNHFQNWMAARKREEGAGFQFFAWDSDMMLRTGVNANVINRGGPGNLWGAISQHPEVRQVLMDRAQKYFFNGGMLTRDRVLADFDALQASLESSIVAETARWGDGAYTPDTWRQNIQRIRNEIVNGRTEVVIQQLRTAGLLPSIEAPAFSINGQPQFGGSIDAGDVLSMSVPPPGGPVLIETPFVTATTAANAIVPTSGVLGDSWRARTYVPGSNGETWRNGQNGVGYDNEAGYLSKIKINVADQMNVAGGNNTVYVRLPFTIGSQAQIDSFDAITLRVLADDGFVAYLNGTQIASANVPAALAWNSAAASGIEVDINSPAVFDITSFRNQLVVGTNVLALQGMNSSVGSSDMLIYAELAGGVIDETGVEADIFYTLDGSDPRDAGAVTYTSAVPLNQSTLVKARSLWNGEWSALSEAVYTLSTPIPLRLTEIMYNPAGADDAEYLELRNVGSGPIELAGFQFTAGIDFTFPEIVLPAGGHVLVVRNQAAFEALYGTGHNIAGEVPESALDNAGEQLALVGPFSEVVFDFAYDDAWRPETDGDGFSLVFTGATAADYTSAPNWRSSARIGGSPGVVDPTPLAADFNGDGVVNRMDAAILAGAFGLASGGYRSLGDANGDGHVDVIDLAIVQRTLGQTVAGSPAAADALMSRAVPAAGVAHRDTDNAIRESAALLRVRRRNLTETRPTETRLTETRAAAEFTAVDLAISDTLPDEVGTGRSKLRAIRRR